MAEPFMEFDLQAEIHRLQTETTWTTGQNARTLIKFDDLRVVLIALAAKTRMPEHKAEGTACDRRSTNTQKCSRNRMREMWRTFARPVTFFAVFAEKFRRDRNARIF
jgi:hypothetical protein